MIRDSRVGFVAAIVGIALGIATLDMEQLSSTSSNLILGFFQTALVFALVPGLILSVAAGTLWLGAFVNSTFYFVLISAVGSLLQRLHRKQESSRTSAEDPLG